MVSEFEVTRRILVDLDGINLKRKWLAGLEPDKVHMMIGKSIFSNFCGQTTNSLLQVSYKC